MTTVDDMLSTANIEIHGINIALQEPEMLMGCLIKAGRRLADGKNLVLTCSARKLDGWIEWSLLDNGFYLACIQRQPQSQIEFHS